MYTSVKVSSLACCAIYSFPTFITTRQRSWGKVMCMCLSTGRGGGWVFLVWYLVLRGQYVHGVGMSGGMSKMSGKIFPCTAITVNQTNQLFLEDILLKSLLAHLKVARQLNINN